MTCCVLDERRGAYETDMDKGYDNDIMIRMRNELANKKKSGTEVSDIV